MGMISRTDRADMNTGNSLTLNSRPQQNSGVRHPAGSRTIQESDSTAGNAVSEKIKDQINSLGRAAKKYEDDSQLLQTAEAYMTEIKEILETILETAEKSADMPDSFERSKLQNETDNLFKEIDRIVSSAAFKGISFLDEEKDEMNSVLPVNFHTDVLFRKYTGSSFILRRSELSSDNSEDEYIFGVTADITDRKLAAAAFEGISAVIGYVRSVIKDLVAERSVTDNKADSVLTALENIAAANSHVYDSDMADKMLRYARDYISHYPFEALRAQANSEPEKILSIIE